jgi:hypothetical protein
VREEGERAVSEMTKPEPRRADQRRECAGWLFSSANVRLTPH